MKMALALCVLAFPASLFAQPDLAFRSLGPQPQVLSPNYAAIDIEMTRLNAENWTAAGLFIGTSEGATFVYAPDPNGGTPILTQPDRDGAPLTDAERFVSFVSRPRGQHAPRRFRLDGSPTLVGRFINGAGPPIATPTVIDVAWSRDGFDIEEDPGFIVRLTLDLTNSGTNFADLVYAAPLGQPTTGGDRTLAVGRVLALNNRDFDNDDPVYFAIYVPDDCNGNGIPDPNDLAAGAPDVNANGVPDSCDPDCNENGVPDDLDIAQGVATDCNENGVPDSCDAGLAGCDCRADLNTDGDINLDDLATLLGNFGRTVSPAEGDIDGSGQVTLTDLAIVLGSFGCCCPL